MQFCADLARQQPQAETLDVDACLTRMESPAPHDLPCSGLGIIGRKPDIKYNVTYEKIKELALLQRKILSTVWEYVKKDGILIYSTCTVTPEENAENTEWLVNNYPFELIGKPEQIMPQDGTGDGFYIARLKRTE